MTLLFKLLRYQHYLQPDDIVNLKNYKYKGGDYTWLDNQMNGFWLAAVEYLPRVDCAHQNLAPNLITVYALLANLIPAFLFVFYDPTLAGEYPAIFYVASAIGIFLYQTLDALDGKQARRITAFSPLGQLFDHGCDSFSAASVVIQLLVCLRVQSPTLQLVVYTSYISIVYMSNICEHFTHVLHTSYAQIGVTEVQFAQIFLQVLAAAGALDWMYVPVTVGPLSLQVNHLIAGGIGVVGVGVVVLFFIKSKQVENDSLKILSAMVPMLYYLSMSSRCSPVVVFLADAASKHYTGYIIMAVGILASTMVCKVILGTLAKKPVPCIQPEFAAAIIFPLLICLTPTLVGKKLLVLVFFVLSFAVAGVFSCEIVTKIAKYLEIKILSV